MIFKNGRIYAKSEWNNSKRIFRKERIVYIFLLLIISCCISFVSADGEITRSIDTTNPQPGSLIKVSLHIAEINYSGIVETIPPGFEFQNTSVPSSGVRIIGNSIIFAAINEDTLEYTLKVPDSGSGTITGVFTDIKTGDSKKISDTMVVVQGTPADNTYPQKESSGLLPVTSLIAALIGSIIIFNRRRM